MDNMTVYKVCGQTVTLFGRTSLKMGQVVYVGEREVMGEVFSLDRDKTEIKLLESNAKIRMGDRVRGGEERRSLVLRPGYIGGVYDALMRPILPYQRDEFAVEMSAREDDALCEGQELATVKETESFTFRVKLPTGVGGRVISLEKSGEYSYNYTLAILKDNAGKLHELSMIQHRAVGKAICAEQCEEECDIESDDLAIFVMTECSANDFVAFMQKLRGNGEDRADARAALVDKSIVIRDTALMSEAAYDTAACLAEFYKDMGYRVSIIAEVGI